MNNLIPQRDDVEVQVERFFDEFDAAFVSFDGAVIAERYAEPYLACRSDGSTELLAERLDTARYFLSLSSRRHCRWVTASVPATDTAPVMRTITMVVSTAAILSSET